MGETVKLAYNFELIPSLQNLWDIWKILYEQSWINSYIYINFATNTSELFPVYINLSENRIRDLYKHLSRFCRLD